MSIEGIVAIIGAVTSGLGYIVYKMQDGIVKINAIILKALDAVKDYNRRILEAHQRTNAILEREERRSEEKIRLLKEIVKALNKN